MSDTAKITAIVAASVVFVALILAAAYVGTARAYIDGGFCQISVRHELPDISGRPNWMWDTEWVKCAVTAEAK